MPVIRITKHFEIEMAHYLSEYDGACRNIHGHTYKLEVTLKGNTLDQEGHPKNGMVMDFKDLKGMVKEKILSVYDHALVLPKNADAGLVEQLEKLHHKVVYFPHEPTCELLVAEFAELITPSLGPGIDLHSLRLFETTTSFAEYFPTDNEN